MKTTLADVIKTSNGIDTLLSMASELHLPGRLLFKLELNRQAADPVIRAYDNTRKTLFSRHFESGTASIEKDDSAFKQYRSAVMNLLQIEVDVKWTEVSQQDLAYLDVPGCICEALRPLEG